MFPHLPLRLRRGVATAVVSRETRQGFAMPGAGYDRCGLRKVRRSGTASPLAPVAGGHETAPEERMGARASATTRSELAEARLAGGARRIESFARASPVERMHPGAGRFVFDRPQAHDDGVHSRD